MIEFFLLDMDGVLADFVTPSLAAAEIPLSHDDCQSWNYFAPFMSETEFWRKIDCVDGFWENIQPYPWANELVQMCESLAPVHFCSAPAKHHSCASAKIKWLRNHGLMGLHDDNYLLTRHKWMAAGPNRVLIDDGEHNVEDFVKYGGNAITFPQPWNSGPMLYSVGNNLKVVSSRIEEIANTLSGQKLFGKNKPGESILAEAERLTGNDRQADYGPPEVDFRKTAGMWTSMWEDKLKPGAKFETWDVPQAMVCVKLSRLQHKPKRDSVVDTAGYANCMDYCYRAAGSY